MSIPIYPIGYNKTCIHIDEVQSPDVNAAAITKQYGLDDDDERMFWNCL